MEKKTRKRKTIKAQKQYDTDDAFLFHSLGNYLVPKLKVLEHHLKKDISLLTVRNFLKHPNFMLALAFVIWGASVPLTKIALQYIGPASFLFLRMVIATVILFPFALRQKGVFTVREELYIFFSAILGIGIHIYLIYIALPSVASINVPVINALSPFLLVILARAFFREKIHKNKYYGMAFGFLGAIVITILPVVFQKVNVLGVYSATSFSPFFGDMIILISALFGTVGTILIKPIRHIPGHIITFWQSAIVAVVLLPLAVAEAPKDFIPDMNMTVFLVILFVAILNSVVAYTIYNENIHKVQTSDIGLLSYLAPIAALLIAIPLLGEIPGIWFVVGTVLVLYGVWIAERKVHRKVEKSL